MLYFYQNLPLHIDPIAFKIGFFQVGWYALSYSVGFAVVYGLVKYRTLEKESDSQIFNFQFSIFKQISNSKLKNYKLFQNSRLPKPGTGGQAKFKIQNSFLSIFFLYAILGVIIGGRLGYVLFYNLPYYLSHPLEIISPYDFHSHIWIGIYGMSYHGGLIGVIIAAIYFCRRYEINFSVLSDFIVPAIPAGYFFGRIGNFFNGELYGRITDKSWGMYFFDGKNILLRYPSQLIEALLEGIFVFLILWPIRNKEFFQGKLLYLYILLYGLARFVAEFFREPDEQIGYAWGFLTLGQIFSLAMILGGLFLFIFKNMIQWKVHK